MERLCCICRVIHDGDCPPEVAEYFTRRGATPEFFKQGELLNLICDELRAAIDYAQELAKPIGDETYRLSLQEKLTEKVLKAQNLIDGSDLRVRALPYADAGVFGGE